MSPGWLHSHCIRHFRWFLLPGMVTTMVLSTTKDNWFNTTRSLFLIDTYRIISGVLSEENWYLYFNQPRIRLAWTLVYLISGPCLDLRRWNSSAPKGRIRSCLHLQFSYATKDRIFQGFGEYKPVWQFNTLLFIWHIWTETDWRLVKFNYELWLFQ